jgi:phosphatidylinositol glycan class N
MFADGASPKGKVETFMYGSEAEDFSGDGSHLDDWVFNAFEDFLGRAKNNETLQAELKQEKIVMFFHLLGLDTNGHAHRPYSPEYLNNIRIVDNGIKALVHKIEEFYENDGKTAFVFTADHGMSDRGSHGDGHPDCTETPLIVWGAGIAGPRPVPVTDQVYNYGLGEVERVDLEQADIAPLMVLYLLLTFQVISYRCSVSIKFCRTITY